MTKLIAILKSAWGLLTGSRETVLLIAIAGAAAALYAWGATARKDRDQLQAWAEKACLSAGAQFPGAGKKVDACAQRIVDLAAYERQSQAATNTILAGAAQRQATKSTSDTALARTQVARRTDAAAQMEKADAQIAPDNRVGPDWFDSVNRVAGLRPSGR